MKSLKIARACAVALLSTVASAQNPQGAALLKHSMQSLSQSGFAGLQAVSLPEPPASVRPISVKTEFNETTAALSGLIAYLQSVAKAAGSSGAVLRALGLPVDGDRVLVQGFGVNDSEKMRMISVIEIDGKMNLIIEEGQKVDGKKEVRSFLTSSDGVLRGATILRRVDTVSTATVIPTAEADSAYRNQLEFWIRYYKANLKKA